MEASFSFSKFRSGEAQQINHSHRVNTSRTRKLQEYPKIATGDPEACFYEARVVIGLKKSEAVQPTAYMRRPIICDHCGRCSVDHAM
jgi:hypothetical protein